MGIKKLVKTAEEINHILDNAVLREEGKGLYPDADKSKLEGIADGANKNVQADWNEADEASDAYIKNKPTLPANVVLEEELNEALKSKQDTIEDLDAIRQGAAKGATALQEEQFKGTYSLPEGGIPKDDLSRSVQESLGKADTAIQEHQSLDAYATKAELAEKVDKVAGYGLSQEDFTTTLKNKLSGLENYDDAEVQASIEALGKRLDALVGTSASEAIDTFNEIVAFLNGVEDTATLEGILADIGRQILAVEAKIPNAVTSETVANWGFTKNEGTVTSIAINGEEKTPDAYGIVDLGEIKGGGGVPIVASESELDESAVVGSLAVVGRVNTIEAFSISDLYQPTTSDIGGVPPLGEQFSRVPRIEVIATDSGWGEWPEAKFLLFTRDASMSLQIVSLGSALLASGSVLENCFFASKENGVVTINEEEVARLNVVLSQNEYYYLGDPENGFTQEYIPFWDYALRVTTGEPAFADIYIKKEAWQKATAEVLAEIATIKGDVANVNSQLGNKEDVIKPVRNLANYANIFSNAYNVAEVSGNSTFYVEDYTQSECILQLTLTQEATVTFIPFAADAIKWEGGTQPTFEVGKTYILSFITSNYTPGSGFYIYASCKTYF